MSFISTAKLPMVKTQAKEVVEKNPQIEKPFAPISEKLTTQELQKLNAKVDVEGRLEDQVAEEWLRVHFKTWCDRCSVSGKQRVFGSGSSISALRLSASDTQVGVSECPISGKIILQAGTAALGKGRLAKCYWCETG